MHKKDKQIFMIKEVDCGKSWFFHLPSQPNYLSNWHTNQPVVVARNLEIILKSISLIFHFVQPIINFINSILNIALYSTFSFIAQIQGITIIFHLGHCSKLLIVLPESSVAKLQSRLQAANRAIF